LEVLDPGAIVDIEALELAALTVEDDAAICHDTINIENEELDLGCGHPALLACLIHLDSS
jgi:hypothetical protein